MKLYLDKIAFEQIISEISTKYKVRQEIGKIPVLSFGNSSGDSAMHNYCLSNKNYKTLAFLLA